MGGYRYKTERLRSVARRRSLTCSGGLCVDVLDNVRRKGPAVRLETETEENFEQGEVIGLVLDDSFELPEQYQPTDLPEDGLI